MIRATGGRLHIIDPKADEQLQHIIADTAKGDLAIGTRGIAVSIASANGVHHVVNVLPLQAGLREKTAHAYGAVAAIFIQKATIEGVATPEIIAKTFKLTPTELRIFLAIIEIGGVPEVAMALGIADSTVKTHLSRLYEKTGARRHADLVKIFTAYASPVTI
jgi:DNA-binding CsgD family transcriptional regulator